MNNTITHRGFPSGKIIAIIAGIVALALVAGCNRSNAPAASGGKAAAPQGAGKTDLSAYALSLATPLSAQDAALDFTAKSNNSAKVVWRHGGTTRNMDEHPFERANRQFFIELKKRLGDKVEIQYYPGGTLGTTADQILGGLQARSFESYSYNVGAFAEYTKAFMPLDIMYLIPDFETGIEICDGEPGELMRQRCISDTGLNVILYPVIGMRHITNSKRAIHVPKDMAGLKIRVQNNPLHIMAMNQLGAASTPIAYAELFTSLQQKVVDGQENPISNIFDQNYGEVQSYMTLSDHMYTAGALVLNNAWLLEQSAEFQKAVKESVAIAAVYSAKETLKVEAQLLKEMEKQMEITRLSPEEFKQFQDISKETWSKAADRIGVDYYNTIKASMDKIINASGR